jgi:peroxiredoxin
MTTAAASSETTPIAVGAVAPDFKLPDSEKKEWTLSQFKGQKAVALFFYPLDFSPTCSKENVCFSQDLSRYEKFAQVFGVSVDSVWAHKAYKAANGLKHTLLSDMHRSAIKAYGLFLPAANISQRATVLIDKNGKVAWVKVEADITKERDYKELEAQLAKLA